MQYPYGYSGLKVLQSRNRDEYSENTQAIFPNIQGYPGTLSRGDDQGHAPE